MVNDGSGLRLMFDSQGNGGGSMKPLAVLELDGRRNCALLLGVHTRASSMDQ